MACKNCWGESNAIVYHICRSCELVDNDKSVKQVRFCKLCGAYICKKCHNDIPKRTIAFAVDKKEKITGKIKKAFSKEETEIKEDDKENHTARNSK